MKWTTSQVNLIRYSRMVTMWESEQHVENEPEKQERQDHKASVHRNGGQACSSAIPTYSCGACQTASDSLYLALHTHGKRKILNVGCLNAFPNSTFSPRQTAVIEAVRKE